MAEGLQIPEESREIINAAFAQADSVIMRKYMPEIGSYPVKSMPADLANTNINSVLRLNRIEKIVYDADENNRDKLMTVYNSVALCGGAVIHMIVSDGERVEYYIGTRTANINETATCQAALAGAFEGNFPGTKLVGEDRGGLEACLEKVFAPDAREQSRVISAVSGIPGLRSEDNEEFVQGMEKLIDSMAGKKYALLTIAGHVTDEELLMRRDSYEELYTQLSPFAKVTQTYSESDSSALAKNISDAVTESVGNTVGRTENRSQTRTKGSSSSAGAGIIVLSANMGKNSSQSEQTGYSDSRSDTTNHGTTRTEGRTDTFTATTGQTLQLVRDNKHVADLLQKIEKQIERIENARDAGLWDTATYCIADDAQTSKTLAGTLQSLCRGKKDSIESYSINTWTDPYRLRGIEAYLRKMVHPRFEMPGGSGKLEVSPSSLLSGSELVITAGLPQKAVSGVSVSKMVSFARNVIIEDEEMRAETGIFLGNIYHMGRSENTKVQLSLESLSAHMLVTGSTGSGKSNTVYTILSEARRNGVHFLVVEPAKGEYKHVFGNEPGVNVFGTNSRYSRMLRIDPFSFPDGVHVLEHVDRLVEIFHVCWPLYAAMPAVLKDAILQSYLVCGWDLETSENRNAVRCYPTCRDLLRQIKKVIDSSAYSEEVKSNYIGSLATRISSLTNGLNGQMLSSDEIAPSVLFDGDTIIDLSRVGSQETKSLLMGIIVMKLNEYRMEASAGCMNQRLKHVTVLEEAHHLLRNAQGQAGAGEGSDMAGRSVEMIADSIAEMRTYGEGFIIVDQSPNAIDISAIRNTNTKVLMRLPEENDRRQAGRSAALDDRQISEMAKLPKGVAVVYQNNWLDPVLCKIRRADVEERPYVYEPSGDAGSFTGSVRKMTVMLLVGNRMDEYLDVSAEMIRDGIGRIHISTESRIAVLHALEELEQGRDPGILQEDSFGRLSEIVCEIIRYDSFSHTIRSAEDPGDIQSRIHTHLQMLLGPISEELEYAVSQCVLRMLVEEDPGKIGLYAGWREYAVGQRKKVVSCR